MSNEGYEKLLNDASTANVTEDALARLQRLAEAQAKAERLVEEKELELEKAKDELKDLSEQQIPELMESVGMKEFKTVNGLIISLKESIHASIPKARQAEAFAWLRKNGHAALIRRVVSVTFGKGEDEIASKLFKELKNKKLDAEDNPSVHHSTLSAFVREKLREGKKVPEDIFGIHRANVSTIKLP